MSNYGARSIQALIFCDSGEGANRQTEREKSYMQSMNYHKHATPFTVIYKRLNYKDLLE